MLHIDPDKDVDLHFAYRENLSISLEWQGMEIPTLDICTELVATAIDLGMKHIRVRGEEEVA